MRYLIVAEAYRDLERLSGRLALTDRLAALLAQTPDSLLPTVCYLCQTLIAPEFGGVDLGMAEKLAARAVATATGVSAEQVSALVRETGDLGRSAERLLASPGTQPAGLAAGLEVAGMFRAVTKCGAGFTDADLAALPARLAPLRAAHKPARVDARQEPDVWFEPGLVVEILSAELTLSPNYTAAWGQIRDDARRTPADG
jgi:DNA ligase 1